MKCGSSFGSCKFFPLLQAYRNKSRSFLHAQCFKELQNVHIKSPNPGYIHNEYDMQNSMFPIESTYLLIKLFQFWKDNIENIQISKPMLVCLNFHSYNTVCMTVYLWIFERLILNELVASKAMQNYFCSIIIIIDFYIKT